MAQASDGGDRWKGFVFLPVGLVLLAIALYAGFDARRFLDTTTSVPGVVTALRHGPHHFEVRFTARDGRVIDYLQNGDVTQHAGDRVRVRYDPGDPERTHGLDTLGAVWGTTGFLALLGTAFTAVGAGLLRSRRAEASGGL